MVAQAAMLIEEVPEIEQRDGLFYVKVRVGGSDTQFVARPHLFMLGARRACEVGEEFMAGQSVPVGLRE